MRALENLNWEENKLDSLPEMVRNLKNLKNLDLRENPLKSLPWSITELDSLEEIQIDAKVFKNLPETLQEFIQNVKSQREKAGPFYLQRQSNPWNSF